MTFQPGDIVECVSPYGSHYLVKGRKYVVKYDNGRSVSVVGVVGHRGTNYRYAHDTFELRRSADSILEQQLEEKEKLIKHYLSSYYQVSAKLDKANQLLETAIDLYAEVRNITLQEAREEVRRVQSGR